MIELTGNSQGIEFIRNEADWDTHDVWASLRSLQFDIAEAWYGSAGVCLRYFQPAAGFSDDEWESERAERLYGAMEDRIITQYDVEYWWKVLERMEALILKAGRDY